MWTPLPPERSGIADYAYLVLNELSTIVDIVAVDPNCERSTTAAPVPVVDPDTVTDQSAINVYQIGNDARFHARIYQKAIRDPGIVVLHDTSLLDFALSYLGGLESDEFRNEVEFAHGPIWGRPDDPTLVRGWPAIPVDGINTLDRSILRLERRLITASRAVVVHDPYHAELLATKYPNIPVHTIPHGATPSSIDSNKATRNGLGWDDHHVIFGIFGGIGKVKRIMVSILAFSSVRARWPQVRLLIAGHPDDHAHLLAIKNVINHLEVGDSVYLTLSPEPDRFTDMISTVDAVINLRWPTAGETSGVTMRAFGASKPVITSDIPQNRHYSPTFCWRVSTDPESESMELTKLLENVACDPAQARIAGSHAREYVRTCASWPVVAEAYRDVLESAAYASSDPPDSRPPARSAAANVFADTRATTGLAESARRHIGALLDAGVELTFTEFNTNAPRRSLPLPSDLADLRRGKEYPIDIWFVNINEFALVPDDALDRYTIAVWAWELPEIPKHAVEQVSRVDELWVVSSYVANSLRTIADIPVKVVPCVVPQQDGIADNRAELNFPRTGIIVLFTFSASSSDARKNPWATIHAFRRAFAPEERGSTAHLIIKVNDLYRFPELASALQESVDRANGILLTDELGRDDMDRLLAACDIYISLHRSEGFGLGMAEAMALGKPVIATGYGGNMDFMPPGAAALVGYDARPIQEHDHRFGAVFGDWYEVGQIWADADTDQAARWLRTLADNPSLRQDMGTRAAATVAEKCGSRSVGLTMLRRLEELSATGQLSIHTRTS